MTGKKDKGYAKGQIGPFFVSCFFAPPPHTPPPKFYQQLPAEREILGCRQSPAVSNVLPISRADCLSGKIYGKLKKMVEIYQYNWYNSTEERGWL